MNAKALISNFYRFITLPEDVFRLRAFILDLAVRGKLSAKSEVDWVKTTLGNVGKWGSGGTPNRGNSEYYGGDIPWLVIGDLNEGLVTRAATHITQAGLENSSAKLVQPGTVLIAMYGSIGKLGIAGIECATNQAIAHCVPDEATVSTEYLAMLLKAIRKDLITQGKGGTQQNISQTILKAHEVRVPALAEQEQIVAKVEELMELCDELEQAQTRRERRRDRLATSSQRRMVEVAADPETFPTSAGFYLQRLPRLATRPEHISELRRTILDLAAHGELVGAKAVERDTRPLGEMADFIMGQAPPGAECNDRGEGTLFVKVGEFGSQYPEEKAWTTRPLKFAQKGDVLICVVGATVGKLNLGIDCAIGRSVAAIRPRDGLFDRFLYYSLMPYTLRLRKDSRGSAQGVIRRPDLYGMELWCPEVSVQEASVLKVEELLALCDELENQLREGSSKRSRLLEAVLLEALEPAS